MIPKEFDIEFLLRASLPAFMSFLSINIKPYELTLEELITEKIKNETYNETHLKTFISIIKYFLKFAI